MQLRSMIFSGRHIAAVQHTLGLAQYLAKFLPPLSDITKRLRELMAKDVDFQWDEPQQAIFDALKAAMTNTSGLRYYNLEDEMTPQCASQSGLGVVLMQNGQPVA